ncbi:hypothetical protein YC2023_058102 [Brassica napus]
MQKELSNGIILFFVWITLSNGIKSLSTVINVASRGLLGLRKMGRKTWFDDDGMKKGEWTAEEDQKLVAYINEHGLCDWRSLPERAVNIACRIGVCPRL